MYLRLLVPIAVILSCARAGFGQDSRVERPTFRSEVEVVELVINVMGKVGEHPRKLERKDFRLVENGIEQMLTTFTVEHPSATTARFTLAYTSSTPDIVRKIEVKIRGFRRKIKRTLRPD